MYTYIMKSHDLHKIGKAINVEERIKIFRTGNPTIEVIKVIEGNYESILHKYYKEKRVCGEWFNLTKEEIDYIDTVIKICKPVENTVQKVNKNIQKQIEYNITQQTEEDKEKYFALQEAWYEGEMLMHDIITISLGKDEKGIKQTVIVRNESDRLILTQIALDKLIENIVNEIRKVTAIKI